MDLTFCAFLLKSLYILFPYMWITFNLWPVVLSYSFVLIRFHLLNLSPVCEYFGLPCYKQCSQNIRIKTDFNLMAERRRNIASEYVLVCGLLIRGLSSRILTLTLVIGDNCLQRAVSALGFIILACFFANGCMWELTVALSSFSFFLIRCEMDYLPH